MSLKVLVLCDRVRRPTLRCTVLRSLVYRIYKVRCCRSSGLGKKQVSLRHKRTKATQQDFDNHILLCRTNGIGYVRYSLAPTTVKLWVLCAKSLRHTGNITLLNNYQNFWRFLGEEVGMVAGDRSSQDVAEAFIALKLWASVSIGEMIVESGVPTDFLISDLSMINRTNIAHNIVEGVLIAWE